MKTSPAKLLSRAGGRNLCLALALATIAVFAGRSTTAAAPRIPNVGATAWKIVSKIHGNYRYFPKPSTGWIMPSGPLLGNGDLGVVVAGKPSQFSFFLGKSDFFGVIRGHIMPVGRVRLSVSGLEHAKTLLQQNIGPATVTGRLVSHHSSLALQSWVTRSGNILIIRLHNTGSEPLHFRSQLRNAWNTPNRNQMSAGIDWSAIAAAPDSVLAAAGNRINGGAPAGFKGKVSQVRIFARALKPAQIANATSIYGWKLTSMGRCVRGGAETNLPRSPLHGQLFNGSPNSVTHLGVIRVPQHQFTLLVDVRPQALQKHAFIFAANANPYSPRGYPYRRGLAIGIRNGACFVTLNRTTIISPTPLPLHQWSRITATYTYSTLELFIDGKAVAESIDRDGHIASWYERAANLRQAPGRLPPAGVRQNGNWRRVATGTDVFHGRVGFAWFQTVLPKFPGPVREIWFNRVDDNGTIYLNGIKIATHAGWDQAFGVRLGKAWKARGPNVLTVCVQNTGGAGGITRAVSLISSLTPMQGVPGSFPFLPTAADVMGTDKGSIDTGNPKLPFDGCSPKGIVVQRVLGALVSQTHGTLHFSIPARQTATLVVAVLTNRNTPAYKSAAMKSVAALSQMKLRPVFQRHLIWWKKFWARSFIQIPEKRIQAEWYGSLYDLACCSRPGCNPPGLWGNFIVMRGVGWQGDYTLDYNHEATFWGVFPTNHIRLSNNYEVPMLQNMARAAALARDNGYHGLFGYTHLIPGPGWDDDPSHYLAQKSAWLFSTVDCAMRWRYTRSTRYARQAYPLLRRVAAFWDHYLVYSHGVYVDRNDAPDEWTDGSATNPATTIAFLRLLYPTLIQMSIALHRDAAVRPLWQHILKHLSPLPIVPAASITRLAHALPAGMLKGKNVIRLTQSGKAWIDLTALMKRHDPPIISHSTAGMNSHQCIFPGWAIGMESTPYLRAAALNTIQLQQTWYDFNNTSSFYPAAACAQYNAVKLLHRMHSMLVHYSMLNFAYVFGGGGVENFSTIPNTICAMLSQSYQRNIHLFPDWPKKKDACFGNLLTCGNFLISSAIHSGVVQYVKVQSNAGRTLRLVNPWPGKFVIVRQPHMPRRSIGGKVIVMPTRKGQVMIFTLR